MGKRLNDTDRNILEFRPDIGFIEPEVEPEEIVPRAEVPQLEDVENQRDQLKKFAKAIDTLASAVQAIADQKANGMKVKIDPAVDADVVQAMRRAFPDKRDKDGNIIEIVNPTEITYNQYRDCKDKIKKKGLEIGRKPLITSDEVEKARDQLAEGAGGGGRTGADAQIGGFGTPESRDGRLRPDLDERAQIIAPIDMGDLQFDLIAILVNFIWKKFIKPVILGPLDKIPLVDAGSLLPDKLIDVPDLGLSEDGIAVPGEKPPKKQEPPEIPQSAEGV